jgi:hypothetical protein
MRKTAFVRLGSWNRRFLQLRSVSMVFVSDMISVAICRITTVQPIHNAAPPPRVRCTRILQVGLPVSFIIVSSLSIPPLHPIRAHASKHVHRTCLKYLLPSNEMHEKHSRESFFLNPPTGTALSYHYCYLAFLKTGRAVSRGQSSTASIYPRTFNDIDTQLCQSQLRE